MNEVNKMEGELTHLQLKKFEGERKPGDKPFEIFEYDWPKGRQATCTVTDGDGKVLRKFNVSDEDISLIKEKLK